MALSLVHSVLTVTLYDAWSPDAVWFLGTGLGLLFLTAMNLAHVGLGPCTMPTAPAVRAANWVFVLFGFGALVAVPSAVVVHYAAQPDSGLPRANVDLPFAFCWSVRG